MGGMDFSSRLEFAAEPKTVHQMMVNQGWLASVATRSRSSHHEVSVDGATTRILMGVPTPEKLALFAGNSVTLDQRIVWGEPDADDRRVGQLDTRVVGMPASFRGQMVIAPGGRGTVVQISGVIEVSVPILGSKLEQASLPMVLEVLGEQQAAGDEWLANR